MEDDVTKNNAKRRDGWKIWDGNSVKQKLKYSTNK